LVLVRELQFPSIGSETLGIAALSLGKANMYRRFPQKRFKSLLPEIGFCFGSCEKIQI
jgi:hypothetical protein